MTFDGELRDRFRALREAERAAAPGFAALRSRPARPGVRRMRVPLAAYAALAAGIVLGVAFVAHEARVNRAPEFTLTHSLTHSLTQWTSPTASLLHTPGAELLYAPPPIATSTLDRFISQPATHPGTPQ